MDEEKFIIEVFKSLKYDAKKIPESDNKTPDFLVSSNTDNHTYLVELKTKFDNENKINKRKEKLLEGEVVLDVDSIHRKNRISGVIRSASDQLESSKTKCDFNIIWLYALGEDPEVQIQQFESTLYGIVNIFVLSKDHHIPCYYFDFSDFYNFRDIIDGAIISTTNSLKICLNTYSKKYIELKKSALIKKLQAGVIDPNELEKKGIAYIADCDLNRRDETKLTSYLAKKYGEHQIMPIRMANHKISIMADG